MPLVEEYDVTDPANAEATSLGASRIRELKRAISERLLCYFMDWPTPTQPVTNAAVVTATATEFFVLPLNVNAIYEVQAYTNAQPAQHCARAWFATSTDGSIIIMGHDTPAGSNVTITNVAGSIRVTHTAGANRSITATLKRVA